MGKKTDSNLKRAFAGEAEAHFRALAFAEVAKKEGYEQISRLFAAIAKAESVHAHRALRLRKLISDTEANLERSFGTETFAQEEAYPQMILEAEEEGEKAVAIAFAHARDVEQTHASLYKKAITDMMAERESQYNVCMTCGYITDNTVPDNCPVCQAPKDKFKLVS
jgi:rubrerythrin